MNRKHSKTSGRHPRAGRRRSWGRFDIPVLRPSTTRAKLARRLV